MYKHQGESKPLTPRSQRTNSSHHSRASKVQVLLRIRPLFSNQDEEHFIELIDDSTISINKAGIPQYMKFNYVQDQRPAQEEIYSCIEEAITSVLDGVDSTIFAYGQTGAGKTYTIIGDCPEIGTKTNYHMCLLDQNRGILPRSLERIVQESRKRKDSRISISFFQIYNEKIFDLLSSNLKPLEIRESRGGQISIPGLLSLEIMDFREALTLLSEGLKNRVTGSTLGNSKSSRSHSIFQIKCERLIFNQQTSDYEVSIAHLRVVDLAGSEKFNIPYDLPPAEKQVKIAELKSINGSLSKLGHCISALSSQTRTHIPFRDSKLTRILSDSLIGSSKIRLIICVSPSISSMNETISTLQFADRVKKAIFQKSSNPKEKKKTVDYEEYLSVVEELQKQRKKRKELEILIQKQKTSNEIEVIRENERLREQVMLLKEQMKVFNRFHENRNNFSPTIRKRQTKKATSSFSNKKRMNEKPKISPPPKPKSSLSNELKSSSIDGKNRLNKNKVAHHKHGNKSWFQSKVREFMEKKDQDRELQEKVKKRLLQIKKQIVTHRELFEKEEQEPFANQIQDSLWI